MNTIVTNYSHENSKRILVYKRTHVGDPDPCAGIFGNDDCMRRVRGYPFYAVIGVGGIGSEAQSNDIEPRVMWVGIHAHPFPGPPDFRGPLIRFDRFYMYHPLNAGPSLEILAPTLAKRFYGDRARYLLLNPDDPGYVEAEKILGIAETAAPSKGGSVGGIPVSSTCPSAQTPSKGQCGS